MWQTDKQIKTQLGLNLVEISNVESVKDRLDRVGSDKVESGCGESDSGESGSDESGRVESEIEVRNWGQKSRSEIGVINWGQQLGSEIGVRNYGQKSWSEIWVRNMGQKLGSYISGPNTHLLKKVIKFKVGRFHILFFITLFFGNIQTNGKLYLKTHSHMVR